MISQHRQRIRISTLAAVVYAGVGSLGFVAMAGAMTYGFVIGKVTLFWCLAAIAMGLFLGGLNGVCCVRFFRRMLSVREVRLFEDDRIEIGTWRGRQFTARMPEDIKHILVKGTDFSVTFQVEGRWFLVTSEEFSDTVGINDFFRRFVERVQANSPPAD